MLPCALLALSLYYVRTACDCFNVPIVLTCSLAYACVFSLTLTAASALSNAFCSSVSSCVQGSLRGSSSASMGTGSVTCTHKHRHMSSDMYYTVLYPHCGCKVGLEQYSSLLWCGRWDCHDKCLCRLQWRVMAALKHCIAHAWNFICLVHLSCPRHPPATASHPDPAVLPGL